MCKGCSEGLPAFWIVCLCDERTLLSKTTSLSRVDPRTFVPTCSAEEQARAVKHLRKALRRLQKLHQPDTWQAVSCADKAARWRSALIRAIHFSNPQVLIQQHMSCLERIRFPHLMCGHHHRLVASTFVAAAAAQIRHAAAAACSPGAASINDRMLQRCFVLSLDVCVNCQTLKHVTVAYIITDPNQQNLYGSKVDNSSACGRVIQGSTTLGHPALLKLRMSISDASCCTFVVRSHSQTKLSLKLAYIQK